MPAGVLRDKLFDPDRPQYLNYGTIGKIIGHEFIHGFDDIGRKDDEDGNALVWWEPEINRNFQKKIQCIVKQFTKYNDPKNGFQTC